MTSEIRAAAAPARRLCAAIADTPRADAFAPIAAEIDRRAYDGRI